MSCNHDECVEDIQITLVHFCHSHMVCTLDFIIAFIRNSCYCHMLFNECYVESQKHQWNNKILNWASTKLSVWLRNIHGKSHPTSRKTIPKNNSTATQNVFNILIIHCPILFSWWNQSKFTPFEKFQFSFLLLLLLTISFC